MIRVAITGGIGSGKSLVCQVFSLLGAPVYYADKEARILTDTNTEIKEQLISLLGKSIYFEGMLNRQLMAELIFNNKELLAKVNRIIHPGVHAHFHQWCRANAQKPYIIHESAIIFESGISKAFDKIIGITAPENIRLKRVMDRENMTAEKFSSILQNQLSEGELARQCDFVIVNDEKTLIIPQVLKLHQIFISI